MKARRLGHILLLCLTLGLLALLPARAGAPYTYRVRSGDTLPSIASRFGVPLEDLLRAHGLHLGDTLYAGDVLLLPLAPAAQQHVVAPGETLQEIAARYGVAATQIAWRNGLVDPQRLRAGETLAIPDPQTTAPALDVALAWPVEGQRIRETLHVSGWGQAFDNELVVQVQAADSTILAEKAVAIHAEIGQVGALSSELSLPEGLAPGETLLVTVLRRDQATGSLAAVESIPVVVR